MAKQGATGLKLGSPEWVEWMKQKKAEKVAAGDTAAKGGAQKKPTREEAREKALERLVPQAIKKLESQMNSEDERIAQTAAIKILEWGKGKPKQVVENTGEQTTVIRYETSAIGSEN